MGLDEGYRGERYLVSLVGKAGTGEARGERMAGEKEGDVVFLVVIRRGLCCAEFWLLLLNYKNKKAFSTSLPPPQDSSFNWTFSYPKAFLLLWYRSAILA